MIPNPWRKPLWRVFPMLWLMVSLVNLAFSIGNRSDASIDDPFLTAVPELFVNDDNTTGPGRGLRRTRSRIFRTLSTRPPRGRRFVFAAASTANRSLYAATSNSMEGILKTTTRPKTAIPTSM